jgi:cobalamin biosynthetic protein CobC
LRSVGKFFGLAGIRLGFAAGRGEIIDRLRESLGPWAVNHPARVIGRLALADAEWQKAMRATLAEESRRLQALLRETVGLQSASVFIGGCPLFQTLHWPERAAALFEHCARKGVYVRLFAEHGRLRFGFPADEAGWRALEEVLATFDA